MTVYPIAQGRLINVTVCISHPELEGTAFDGKEVEERTTEELIGLFEGWDIEVQQLIQVIRTHSYESSDTAETFQCIERPSRWAFRVLTGLPLYTHGRVVVQVVGDAVRNPI